MASEAITRNDLIAVINNLLPIFYPVGSYYETSDTTFNPNTEWGGTWELELAGQVHVSSGTGYSVAGALTNQSDGGNKDAIIPYHNHTTTKSGSVNGGGSCSITSSGAHTHTQQGWLGAATGSKEMRARKTISGDPKEAGALISSGAHTHSVPAHSHTDTIAITVNYAGTDGNTTDANLQPYIIVNRWHRTA